MSTNTLADRCRLALRKALIAIVYAPFAASAATQDGALRMEVITAYNFVVDSNIESPAGQSPSAAHLGVKLHNDGTTTLTNVVVKIGDLTNPSTGAGTPGTFESRTPTALETGGLYSGTFSLQMPGGAADAVRVIPSIAPGETVVQYFFVTYPLKDSSGKSVTGSAPVTEDDLWLNYDLWAQATEGAATRRVDQTTKVTMRNEISAMANKIWPNGDNKVPPEYLDVIQGTLGWRPQANTPRIPGAAMVEGVWYDLGNVGAGFDNNGDGVPDRNAWLQPVGDPNLFSPLGARMVKCYGLLIIKLNDGTEQLLAFEDQLYFENIPANNNGAVGLVFYEFLPLDPAYPTLMSPYQEVASGYDNEKFNSDYGTSIQVTNFTPPNVSMDKNGPTTTDRDATVTYTLTATNNRTDGIPFGWPELSTPAVFTDNVPDGLLYVAGSATSSNIPPPGQSFTVTWSTDGGVTWSTTEPANGAPNVWIRWTLSGALASNDGAPGGSDTATVSFQARVPVNYAPVVINNTGCIGSGGADVACDSTTTRVLGLNTLGDFVWRDLDRDGIQDGGSETGIANIRVSLYYDVDGDGVLDPSDTFFDSTSTNASGIYGFSFLPDGKYIVVVDQDDTDLPLGFTLSASTPALRTADLDSAGSSALGVGVDTVDWPFIPALTVVKSANPTTYGAGQLVDFTIDLENHMLAVPTSVTSTSTAYASSVTCKAARTSAVVPTNAQGAPNSNFARIDFSQDADYLESSGFSYTTTNNITKVELVFRTYLSAAMDASTPDSLLVQLKNGAAGTYSTVLTANKASTTPAGNTSLDALVGPVQDYVVNVTSLQTTWTPALVQAIYAKLEASKAGQADTGTLWVDSIGLRVTTDAPPVSSGSYGPNTIEPLPLVDTFDNTKLQFVSASQTPDNVSGGTITWNNVGPLNAGSRKTITVTFRTLMPSDTNGNGEPDPTTTTNVASVTNAYFVSGRRTNDGSDDATITINPTGYLGDRIWWDIDADGVQDPGEPGLANVRVFLNNGLQAFTDTNGNYLFTGLANGTYTVTVDPATLPWTPITRTYDPDTNTPANQRDDKSVFTINLNDGSPANDFSLAQDFGYDSNVASLISGTVYMDNNGDGGNYAGRDAGENPIAGVTVWLSDGATVLGSTITDANGYYQFASITTASTYTVSILAPPTPSQTYDYDGILNNATSVGVTLGNNYPLRDFAYKPVGALALGDTVYTDWNGNATQDSGEAGISGVPVSLYEDANGDGTIDPANDALVATTTTNGSGVYGFSSLVAGNYIVVVNTSGFPAGYVQTQDYDGFEDNRGEVNLTATNNDVDFGYQPTGTGSIGNLVWLDANNNGLKDVSESGIDGVVVQLYLSTQTPGVSTPVAVTTTSGGGAYGFTNLAPASYVVYLPASNFTGGGALVNTPISSSLTVSTDDAVDNDDNGIQSAYGQPVTSPVIVLAAAETDLTKDFGFTGVGSAGDFVFYDSNGNGTQDYTEAGIGNVTVRIYVDANGDGIADTPSTPLASTVTSTGGVNPVGYYRFDNLAPGYYFIQVDTSTLPAGLTYTSDPDRDGIPVGTAPPTPPGDHADSLVLVTSGLTYSGADFGYKAPGSIGDFVWLDLNQDGVQDSGEPGIANVALQITDGTTTHNVTTDPDGYWSQILADGNWTVTVVPSNFLSGGPLANLQSTFDADGIASLNTTSITLAAGVVTVPASLPQGNLGIDFGYKLNGIYSLSGTIAIHDTGLPGTADDVDDFYDDGVDMDAGPADETEIAGVDVFLYTLGGDFLGSTVTDSNGDYVFSGLVSGSYRVIMGTTAPPFDNATLTTTTGNNLNGFTVTSTSTSVNQVAVIGTSNVVNVDFTFNSNLSYDYGDLPSAYGMTTLTQDGARHIIPSGGSTLYLGTAPDADLDGAPSSMATGDDASGSDDENGVTAVNPSSWTDGVAGPATGGKIQVNVTGSGWLVGWIDFNSDNDLLDSGEMVISQAVSAGTSTISFDIPAGSILVGTSQSWLSRFRLFASQPLIPAFSYTGEVTDGEVEDHLIEKPVGASIGDLVWIDTDGDGVVDSGESGIGGRVVELRDALNAIVATQTTSNGGQDVDADGVDDPLGYYRFRGLVAGTYTVTVSNPPSGYTPSYDENGVVTPHVTTVVLATDAQHLTADFGYTPALANLSGQVRYDADGDGDPLDTDVGALGVKIQLWTDPNGDGNPADGTQVGETYTDNSGNYLFSNVATGNYVVVEINPPGSSSTYDVVGANDDRIPVAMAGIDVTGRDFLDTLPPVYDISGTVYEDAVANNNVIDGADTPLSGITVKLFFDRDADGLVSPGDTELASTTTNASGDYLFAGLSIGKYVVQKTNPGGATVSNDWDAQGVLSDSQIAVELVNANVVDRDFLIDDYLGSITGSVLVDTDNNGTGDLALQGVILSLVDASGNPVLDGSSSPITTTTASDGSYSFTGLLPGTYGVKETQPAGYVSLSDKDGGNLDEIRPIVVTGVPNTLNDFIEISRCPDTWADWKQLHPTETAIGNPDADSYNNFTEFAFAMPYDSGIGSEWLDHDAWIIRESTVAPDTIEGVFIRPTGAPINVVYKLQYAVSVGNPTTWSSTQIVIDTGLGGNATAVNNGDCTETVTIHGLETLTGLTGGTGVVRIVALLDDDGGNDEVDLTTYTETEGWTRSGLSATCQTFNIPYVRESVFTGTVSSVSGQNLTFAGDNLTGMLLPGSAYYVEITSGDNEGKRYDIVSASGTDLVLASDTEIYHSAPFNNVAGSPPASLVGDTVAVRRHWTLGDAFPVTDFKASDAHTTSDELQIFFNGAWTTYWVNDLGDSDPLTARWVLVDDAGLVDQSNAVIPSGHGVFVTRRGAPMQTLAYGEIRTNKFIRPLQTGSNFVGGGYPVDQSPTGDGSRQMTLSPAGFFGSRDFKTADSIYVWKGDANAATTGYDHYFLLSTTKLSDNSAIVIWKKKDDPLLTPRDSTILMLDDRAVFIRSANNLPAYTVPSPWTP